MEIKECADRCHQIAEDHGFWDNGGPSLPEMLVMAHAELSEAITEYQHNRGICETYYSKDGKPEGIPTELADCIIRIFDYCNANGIDIEWAIHEKLEFNKTRPYRHGGKRL